MCIFQRVMRLYMMRLRWLVREVQDNFLIKLTKFLMTIVNHYDKHFYCSVCILRYIIQFFNDPCNYYSYNDNTLHMCLYKCFLLLQL